MRSWHFLTRCLVLLGLLVGCSDSDSPSPTQEAVKAARTVQPTPVTTVTESSHQPTNQQAAQPSPEKPEVTKTLEGKVVGVTDGDTVTLLVDHQQYKIRLAGIDAPERKQAYGTKSKLVLSELVTDTPVTVTALGTDKYDRTLGIIYADGQCVNTEMVRQGAAWHYVKYSDSKVLAEAEADARQNRRGLWHSPKAMPPWEFRHLPVEAPKATQTTKSTEQIYWLNTKSNVRHNHGCRYYQNTKSGRPCGPNEGKACGICGG